jgi:sucrose-6-phosphate hydrolase SacC (GH32 family)
MNITKEILKTMVLTLLTSACSAREAKTVIDTPEMPESPPATWLTYHLAHPEAEVTATAFDPNPAFFWKGRYHLHYIYKHQTGSVLAHVSSDDMVHWKWHPTVLGPTTMGHGIWSGTGFITISGSRMASTTDSTVATDVPPQ